MTEDNKDAVTEDYSSDNGDKAPTEETHPKEETAGDGDKESASEPKHETPTTTTKDKRDKDDKTESKDGDAAKDGESKSSAPVKRQTKGPRKIKVVRTQKVESTEPAKVTRIKVKDDRLAPVVKGRQKTHVRVTDKNGEVQNVETFGRRVMKRYWF